VIVKRPVRILFVCLGNICRSPLAEGVFRHLVREAGLEDRFEIDSAGTGSWHVGEPPDPRTGKTAASHGVKLDGRARQLTAGDLERYDLVLAMDRDNLHDILYLDPKGSGSEHVRLFREFDPDPGDLQVPDPYYGGPEGFEAVYRIVERTSQALLASLVAHYGLGAP
jgi:protein-tyrosine phosphatase